MRENWPECIDFTLASEGGYDANPKDRGNWTTGVVGEGELKGTKYGIAAHVYPDLDIKNLTRDRAVAIYRKDYWPKVAGDAQPAGVDLVTWDICVNSGSGRALQIERSALGTDLQNAMSLAAAAMRVPDKPALIKSMCVKRAAFYRSLKTFSTFGKGWLNRNARCEAKAVTMSLRGDGKPAAEIKKRLDTESKKAGTAKTANGTATAAPTAAPATTPDGWGFDWATAGKVALIAGACVLIVYFARQAILHHQRQKAYADAAKGIIGA